MLLSSFTASKNNISISNLSITYGVVLGIGFSLVYTPSLVILGHYFEKRLGVVNGIVTSGSSVFTVFLPIFLPPLFTTYGVRTTFQILSAMVFVLILCSLTFAEKPKDDIEVVDNDELEKICITKETVTARRRGLINGGIWRNKMYILWVTAIPIALFGYFVPYAYLPEHVKQILPGYNSDLLVTFIGAFSGIGRLVFGKISDYPQINSVILQQVAFIAIGTLTVLLVFPKAYVVFIILCCGFGLFDGCFISLIGPIAHKIVGQRDASQAIGFLLGFCSIPLTIGPPLAGYLYDLNGNYILAFILSGVPPFIGALLMLPILRQQRREEKMHKFASSSKESTETKSEDANYFDDKIKVQSSEEQKTIV
ncbi:Monocarboxylate transporter 10-like protein [Leptotrombidium deliense]|uniref:Monocarboxylate transporter 10-like protein n=1 Tax=Leptotrombidium deliense TaxID=299467 RepID=A0A443STG4_9ACAR|nr:Monocarboxylate transporter 10-like protein [Leptotrombidium deliense]